MLYEEVFGRIRPIWLVGHHLLGTQRPRQAGRIHKTCLGVPSVQDIELVGVISTGFEAHIFMYTSVDVGALCSDPVPCLVHAKIAEGGHELTHFG